MRVKFQICTSVLFVIRMRKNLREHLLDYFTRQHQGPRHWVTKMVSILQYFSGSQFKEERIRGLTKLKNSDQDFIMAKKRKKWVDFLMRRERMSQHHIRKAMKHKKETIATLKSTKLDLDVLYTRIRKYSQLQT